MFNIRPMPGPIARPMSGVPNRGSGIIGSASPIIPAGGTPGGMAAGMIPVGPSTPPVMANPTAPARSFSPVMGGTRGRDFV